MAVAVAHPWRGREMAAWARWRVMPAMEVQQAVTTGGGGTGGYVEFLVRCAEGLLSALGKVWGAL